MTNIARQIARSKGWRSDKPQPTIFNEDGGYSTLHPTKGWKTMSAKRIAAQIKVRNMVG